MLDEDFDKVVDLCSEQAAVWKEQRASRVTDREVQERRVVELEAIIARLVDAIEQGQPVGNKLKERQQELDSLRWKLEEQAALPDRGTIKGLIESIRLEACRGRSRRNRPHLTALWSGWTSATPRRSGRHSGRSV